MKDKLDVKYTLEDSNGNKYTILDTQRVDLQEELNKNIEKQAKEINRLHSIIKEVREYIEKSKSKLPLGINDFTCEMVYSDEVVLANELLEILDKVDKENNNE